LLTYKRKTIFDNVETVLRAIDTPRTFAKIQRSSGLRWDILRGILNTLEETTLIKRGIGQDSKKIIYTRTEKGIQYIEHCEIIKNLINYKIIE
jgi:predicted transcriptional regulator